MSFARDYLAETARVIQAFPEADIERLVAVLEAAWRDGRRIFCCGNGGSGSLASHWACDFNKGCQAPGSPKFKVIALTDNLPTLLAYGNDVSYDEVFVAQLPNLFEPGDVVLGISGSGNSENVVRALAWARRQGGVTAGLIGFGGGRMKPLCDVALIADSDDMQHCEDAHVVLMHLLMQVFCRRAEQAGGR